MAPPAAADDFIAQRVSQVMEAMNLDALVAFSKENVAYQAGYTVPSQALGVRNRQFAVMTRRDGQSAMLLTSNEVAEAERRSSVGQLAPYDEFTDDPMEVLGRTLAEMGLTGGRVGFELDALTVDRWESLRAHAPCTVEPARKAFARARMIKSRAEQERLRLVATVADRAQAEAYAELREGMTERDLYRLIADRALAHGADSVLMVQVAAGERSALSNPVPTDRPLRRGDVVKVDNFFSRDGYLCDTGRLVIIGEANEFQRRTWQNMQAVRHRIHALVRPGTRTSELWRVFTEGFREFGLTPAIRFLGHGLGLSLHEEPYIAAHTDSVLEEGMVLAIEPVALVGDTKFFLEDNLVVGPNGAEVFTSGFGDTLTIAG